jgi:hypothetical protein
MKRATIARLLKLAFGPSFLQSNSNSRLAARKSGCGCGVLLVSAFAVSLLAPVWLGAQTATTGALTGTVKDPSGSVIAGAQVQLSELATNQVRTQITNQLGGYTFAALPPGVYKITATAAGFSTSVVSSAAVQVAKSFTVDFTLQVGSVTETVKVVANLLELQTADATVGNVLGSDSLLGLPSLRRDASEFLLLQPATIPYAGFGERGGGAGGARQDQNSLTLDGIDVTDSIFGGGAPQGGQSGFRTVIPVPVESVEEFRVGVSNPNASFGRSAGGQMSLVGRRGSNSFHGAVWEFLQNDNLNANSWTDNRAGVPRAEQKDNRYGGRLGGPIWRDRTFFFGMFEGRKFQRAFDTTSVVPTDSLRQGILRFQDAAGNVNSYNLANSMLCGPSKNQACDPRSLGLSPSVKAVWALMPPGNDPSLGDGLNTTGYRASVPAPDQTRYGVLRLDHSLTKGGTWLVNASGTYYRDLATSPSQLSIVQGKPAYTSSAPQRGENVTLGLTGILSKNMTNSFRFGWTRDRSGYQPDDPGAVANLLQIPGTNTSAAGYVALNVAGLSQPIDIGAQPALVLTFATRVFQFADDLTHIKGNHTFQLGFDVRQYHALMSRSNKGIGAFTTPIASLATGGFTTIPASSRPPVCSGPGQVNCLLAADVSRWNQVFADVTGMVDNVSVLLTRDGSLNPLPLGSPVQVDATLRSQEFYFQDTWKINPALTVSLGIRYGWSTPPQEKFDRQVFLTDIGSGQFIDYGQFMDAKLQAGLAGASYNPQLGFTPIAQSGRRGIYNVDRGDWAPRASVAWSPRFEGGLLGRLFGSQRTVFRAGFGIVYDRVSLFEAAMFPIGGVGFSQTLTVQAPRCTANGTGGAGCVKGGADPLSAFRVGVDGMIPLTPVPAISSPIIPPLGLTELLSITVDPHLPTPRNYVFNFTIQRELPANLLLEVGYMGRLGRDLPSNTNLNSDPIFQKDPVSGQTFAQAFDAVAGQLRAGVPAANVTPQPFFQNQMPGGTAAIVASNSSNFIVGGVPAIFRTIDATRLGKGLSPFDNLQVLELFVRTHTGQSNYNAGFVDLRKRFSQGLILDANYTFSKSLDQQGIIQRDGSLLDNSFYPNFEYGPSLFDRTHVLNASFVYDLPAGKGHRFGSSLDRLFGGWQVGGIFRAASGVPLIVTQGAWAMGGGSLLTYVDGMGNAAIPTLPIGTLGSGVHSGVTGSNNVGTNGDPAHGGTGLNMFADPQTVFNSFRPISLSSDGRGGRANPLRSFPEWNLDATLSKRVLLREKIALRFSADFFNLFNHVTFVPPSLDLTNPRAFGVIIGQYVPSGRTSGSRWIQLGLRLDF